MNIIVTIYLSLHLLYMRQSIMLVCTLIWNNLEVIPTDYDDVNASAKQYDLFLN